MQFGKFSYFFSCARCVAQKRRKRKRQKRNLRKPPYRLGYAGSNVGNVELNIYIYNTHVVKTEADFEFWRDVQCREKLFVGNENGEIIEVGKRETRRLCVCEDRKCQS